MIVSTILLTEDDMYVDLEGNLPKRQSFDKALLTALCEGQVISPEAVEMLPASIIRVAEWDDTIEPEMPITIREIDGLTDLLIVSRSLELISQGKVFDLNKSFKLLVKDRKIEIWKRKRT